MMSVILESSRILLVTGTYSIVVNPGNAKSESPHAYGSILICH
jgi:hypothetical protein